MGKFFRECRTQYSMFSSLRSLKILGRSSLLNSTISDGLDLFFSEFPSFTQNTQPRKLSSNVLVCRLLDWIVLEIFPTRYSTRLDFCRGGVAIGKLAHGCIGAFACFLNQGTIDDLPGQIQLRGAVSKATTL